MSKKKKKKKLAKKSKFKFPKFPFLILAIALILALYDPTIVPDDKLQANFQTYRQTILTRLPESITDLEQLSPQVGKVAGITNLLPANLKSPNEDIYIDQSIEYLSTQLKNLPKDQLNRITVEFCKDVINATKSADFSQ